MLNKFFHYFSFKDITLIIMTVLCIFMFISYINTSNSSKREIKRIEQESKEIQKERNRLTIENIKLKGEENKNINQV